MTKNQIEKALRDAGFNVNFVMDVSKNYLEVFDGDPLDYDGNQFLRDEAMRITGMKNYCNIAYGGWMISNEPFSFDSGNCK